MAKYVAMAALAAASCHGFSIPSAPGLSLRTAAAASRSASVPEISMVAHTSRRDVLFAAAAATLAAGASPAAAVDQAKCTFTNCPAPTGQLQLDLLEVKPGKFSGQGYTIQKPTEDTFKRVISPSSLASPGGLLFRDKLDADTAIFSTVQEVKSGAGWKPTLVESYTKEFGNRFNVISKEGPVKKGAVDYFFFEYTVETTIAGAQVLVHYYSTFAAGEKHVYVVNASCRDTNNKLIGKTLEQCAKSLTVNE